MSHAAESREVLLELDTGLAAGRCPLAQHFQNRPFLLRAIFGAILYLQVELDLWRAHAVEYDLLANHCPEAKPDLASSLYVFNGVPGSAGILAGEECWLVASPARMPALPGTPLNTYSRQIWNRAWEFFRISAFDIRISPL